MRAATRATEGTCLLMGYRSMKEKETLEFSIFPPTVALPRAPFPREQ
jgi:hypothetical protein